MLLWIALAISSAVGQTPASTSPAIPVESITAETVQTRLQAVDAIADIDEETRERLRNLYRQAAAAIEARSTFETVAAERQREIDTAESRLTAIKFELQQVQPINGPAANATLAELEPEIANRDLLWKETLGRLAALNAEPARRQARRLELPTLIATAKTRLGELKTQLESPAPDNEAAQATLARRTLLGAQSMALTAEIDALEKESVSYSATAALLPLQRDKAARNSERIEKEIRLFQQAMETRRIEKTGDDLKAARRESARAIPALESIATANQELAEKNLEVAQRLADVNREHLELRTKLEGISAERKRTIEKVDTVGLSDTFGVLLRSRRNELTVMRRTLQTSIVRPGEVRETRFHALELEDKRAQLTNPENAAFAYVESLNPPKGIDRAALESAAARLYEEQQVLLESGRKNYESLFETLVSVANVEKQLGDEINEYSDFIDERILWLRSQLPLSFTELSTTGGAAYWLFSPANWRQTAFTFADDAMRYPVFYIAFAIWFLAWFILQNRWRAIVKNNSTIAVRRDCRTMKPTLISLVASVGLALFAPVILGFFGWRMTQAEGASVFTIASGWGFLSAAAFMLPLFCLKQICRSEGIASNHFNWSESVRRLIQTTCYWLLLIGTPLALIVATLVNQPEEHFRSSLGRLCMLAFLAANIAAAHFVFRSKSPIYSRSRRPRSTGLFYRLRYVVYGGVLVVPVLLAGLAIAGYSWTASVLMGELLQSAWFALCVLVVSELGLRWMVIRHRILAKQQAERRREVQREQAQATQAANATQPTDAAPMPPPPVIHAVEEPQIDFWSLSLQMQKLLATGLIIISITGLWVIWSDVLPALRLFDEIELWEVAEGEKVHQITLQSFAIATAIAAFAIAAVWNLPGLLEFVLLQRLPLDAGARFAVVTLVRYAIAIFGIVFTLGQLHFQWSEYSWLVAAATVGLSFGLQEIFANFVSGLIVLLERPIRVGDVVTVDGVTGTVTRIQMRATTVTNWDQQEFIVPNKDIVTGRLLNWTLSSSRNRIVITVGVAYGTDVAAVREALLKVAAQNTHVLVDPAPVVTFEAFGDSSLDFVLRCHVADLSVRLETIHELHSGIDAAFKQAAIEIPFPQRDLHFRNNGDASPHDSNGKGQGVDRSLGGISQNAP